jgi:hypothetical protein
MTDASSRYYDHYDHYDYIAEKREEMDRWCAEIVARRVKRPLR